MEEEDDSLEAEVTSEMQEIRQALNELELEVLLSGPYDANNAILTLHAVMRMANAATAARIRPQTMMRTLPSIQENMFPSSLNHRITRQKTPKLTRRKLTAPKLTTRKLPRVKPLRTAKKRIL